MNVTTISNYIHVWLTSVLYIVPTNNVQLHLWYITDGLHIAETACRNKYLLHARLLSCSVQGWRALNSRANITARAGIYILTFLSTSLIFSKEISKLVHNFYDAI